ncbi:MAG: NYN domain-containing protein [Actinomycetota bacterium]|nr:NYN domain-containing protein [Actinomycetota bacterium]
MLYLFDGYNLLHAGRFRSADEVVDRLASFLAIRGARGVVVFDGAGDDVRHGPLEVRYARPADHVLERLAADRRGHEPVVLVSSDRAIRQTAGQEVTKVASKDLARELAAPQGGATTRSGSSRVEDALDAATRDRLERLRRGRG